MNKSQNYKIFRLFHSHKILLQPPFRLIKDRNDRFSPTPSHTSTSRNPYPFIYLKTEKGTHLYIYIQPSLLVQVVPLSLLVVQAIIGANPPSPPPRLEMPFFGKISECKLNPWLGFIDTLCQRIFEHNAIVGAPQQCKLRLGKPLQEL